MGEWILTGFGFAFAPLNVAAMTLGVVIGMAAGAIPGLTGATAMTILLPLTFAFPAETGILFLLAIWNAAVYAGSIPAIVLDIPGTAAAASVAIEGHEMARRGLARRALRASVIGSTVGGFVSAAALLFLSPPLAALSLRFGPAELFAFAFFGMATVVSLSSGSLLRGLIGALIGLLMATVGLSPDGRPRFVFDPEFISGFPLIPTLIGVFTIPVVLDLILEQRRRIAVDTARRWEKDSFLFRAADWAANAVNFARSAVIGVVVGILPGAGPTIAGFVAYGEARRAARPPHEFGRGDVRGVIAADTANNAAVFSSLVPALTLGIPGSVDAVIILAALTMHGLLPGPQLFDRTPEIVYTVFAGIFVANALMLLAGVTGARWIARVTRVRLSVLAPVILILSLLGAYAYHNNAFDVALALGLGLAAWVLRLIGVPLAPLILGLILGVPLETHFTQATTLYDGPWAAFALRPIALTFLVLAMAGIAWSLWRDLRARRRAARNPEEETR